MKKRLLIPLLILSSSLAFAGSCGDKECPKDKKSDKAGAIVETSTFAGVGCGSCSGDKKKATEESGFTAESSSLLAGGCGSCSGDKKEKKKEKKKDPGFSAAYTALA